MNDQEVMTLVMRCTLAIVLVGTVAALYRSNQEGFFEEAPKKMSATIRNEGADYYVVEPGTKDISVGTIFFHKPEDEPMLHYVIRAPPNKGVKLTTLPAGTTTEVWIVETMGRCWMSAPVALPKPGEKLDLEMTVAMCI